MPVPVRAASETPRKLIADEIYDSLRDLIIRGELLPGEPLREIELAEYFEVSRTPVHEAIGKLGVHGFAELLPQRGGRVARLSGQVLRDLLQINSILLVTLCREAAPDLTEADFAELREFARRAAATAEGAVVPEVPGDVRTSSVLEIFNRRAHNTVMAHNLGRTWPHISRGFLLVEGIHARVSTERNALYAAMARLESAEGLDDCIALFTHYRQRLIDEFVFLLDGPVSGSESASAPGKKPGLRAKLPLPTPAPVR